MSLTTRVAIAWWRVTWRPPLPADIKHLSWAAERLGMGHPLLTD